MWAVYSSDSRNAGDGRKKGHPQRQVFGAVEPKWTYSRRVPKVRTRPWLGSRFPSDCDAALVGMTHKDPLRVDCVQTALVPLAIWHDQALSGADTRPRRAPKVSQETLRLRAQVK
jgi:hypothetical protein